MGDQLKHHNENELHKLLQQFSSKKVADRSVQLAQRAFYDYMVDKLEDHAMLIVSCNKELAQVALQEAWANIFKNAHTFDPEQASVSTWAKMITKRCALTELRRFYKHEMRNKKGNDTGHDVDGFEEDLLDSLPCPLPSVEERVHAQQVQRAIAACIDTLPSDKGPNYKLAMKLTLEEDLTRQEMSEILSLQSPRYASLNAEQVRGWVRQAVLKMKSCINQKLGRTDTKESTDE